MWWGKGPDKTPKEGSDAAKEAPKTSPKEIPEQRKEFDPKKLPELEKLPPALQKILDDSDKNENFYDELVSG